MRMFQRLEAAIGENRLLKSDLSDTKTSIALLKAELAQTRSQYESKCSELSMERENRMEHMYELDNLHRQLNLLQSANQKLQDTNDGLREFSEAAKYSDSLGRSPRSFQQVWPLTQFSSCKTGHELI